MRYWEITVEDYRGQCFVMQPFDHGRYDSLFEQVFAPAIRDAKLTPYRVDIDPSASIPIETVEQEIGKSLACFGEISENNPNVWFELGYALAREKPLCLVCSDSREKFPFDVQHRKIIKYPAHPLPKDFEQLRHEITSRLVAMVEKDESRRQNAETASALAVVPKTSGLTPHELLALTLVFEEHFSSGVSAWQLAENMKKGGYIRTATNLAVMGLLKKDLIEKKVVEDQNGYPYDGFFVTARGADWLIYNQEELNLRLPSEEPSYGQSKEISDDDIPF